MKLITLTRIMQPQQQLRLRHRKRTQRNIPEPRRPSQHHLPRPKPLVPLSPVLPLRRHNILNLPPEPYLLHRQPLPAIRRQRRLKRIKHRRVMVHRLHKPLLEHRVVVVGLPLRHRDHGGAHGLDAVEEEDEAVAVGEEAVEVVDAVDD